MRCGSCGHKWHVTAEWIARFNQALETCPACGTDCQGEDRPEFCVVPDEPLHNDGVTREHYWYHSSTHSNWPDKDFDPAAELTEITIRRMGATSGAVESWADRQKSKALHLGSYEAAIENMFRRMRDQGDDGAQFYLYRVQLTRDCVIEPGIQREPTNWIGDANLADVCRPGVQVLRYVNVHEDPSSVSLAIELNAIHGVQGIAIPLQVEASDTRIVEAVARLRNAASEPTPTRGEIAKATMATALTAHVGGPQTRNRHLCRTTASAQRHVQRGVQRGRLRVKPCPIPRKADRIGSPRHGSSSDPLCSRCSAVAKDSWIVLGHEYQWCGCSGSPRIVGDLLDGVVLCCSIGVEERSNRTVERLCDDDRCTE